MSDPVKLFYYVAPLAIVALVALVATIGFPLLIALADLAAFLALGLVVGLTAVDLIKSARPARAAAPRAIAQPA